MYIKTTRIRPMEAPHEARLAGQSVAIEEIVAQSGEDAVVARRADLRPGATGQAGDVTAAVVPFEIDKFKAAGVSLKFTGATAGLLGIDPAGGLGTSLKVLQVSVSGADFSRKWVDADYSGLERAAAGVKFGADVLGALQTVVPQLGPYIEGAKYVSVVIEGTQVLGLDRWAGQRFAEIGIFG